MAARPEPDCSHKRPRGLLTRESGGKDRRRQCKALSTVPYSRGCHREIDGNERGTGSVVTGGRSCLVFVLPARSRRTKLRARRFRDLGKVASRTRPGYRTVRTRIQPL